MAGDEAEKNRAAAEAEAAEEGGAGGEQQTREEPLLGDDEHDAVDVETRISNAVEAALTEQRDSVLRAQAEVQNMRRRCEMDVEKAHKFALERFGAELLPVVDNLERALQAAEGADQQAAQALYEGVELTLKGFLETLAKFNIEQIDPQGEPFDPQLHEAITTQPNDDVEPNTVLTVVQKGYTLNGRVIRPAMVVVSKAGA